MKNQHSSLPRKCKEVQKQPGWNLGLVPLCAMYIELWFCRLKSYQSTALIVIMLLMALGVLITTILGITATLLVSLQSRRRELAIFRALGVKPYQLLSLILIEAFLVCLSGIILGWFVLQGLIYTSADYLRREWGVVSEPGLPTPDDLLSLLYLVIIVLLFAGIPAIKAYRMALNDGLNPPS